MDAAIAKTTNDELKKLQLKLEILEEQLREAQMRADLAEEQLALYQRAEQQQQSAVVAAAAAPPPPPPPPPPLPAKLLFAVGAVVGEAGGAGSGSFSQHIAAHNLHKGTSDKIIDNVKQQVQAQAATGMSKPPSTPIFLPPHAVTNGPVMRLGYVQLSPFFLLSFSFSLSLSPVYVCVKFRTMSTLAQWT